MGRRAVHPTLHPSLHCGEAPVHSTGGALPNPVHPSRLASFCLRCWSGQHPLAVFSTLSFKPEILYTMMVSNVWTVNGIWSPAGWPVPIKNLKLHGNSPCWVFICRHFWVSHQSASLGSSFLSTAFFDFSLGCHCLWCVWVHPCPFEALLVWAQYQSSTMSLLDQLYLAVVCSALDRH